MLRRFTLARRLFGTWMSQRTVYISLSEGFLPGNNLIGKCERYSCTRIFPFEYAPQRNVWYASVDTFHGYVKMANLAASRENVTCIPAAYIFCLYFLPLTPTCCTRNAAYGFSFSPRSRVSRLLIPSLEKVRIFERRSRSVNLRKE